MPEFQLGDRVEIADGVLKGEPATIIADVDGVWTWTDSTGTTVLIRFDRKDAVLGPEKGDAVLRDYWEYVESLRKIS